MPLLPIPSQPILFTPTGYDPDVPRNDIETEFCPPCAGDRAYCLKVANGDYISFQMNNQPDLLDFSGNNCDFYTLVYEMDAKADWTNEATWSCAGDGEPWIYTPGGAPGTLSLTGGFTPVADQWYLLTVDITLVSSDVFEIYWGATLLRTIGGAPGGYVVNLLVQAPDAIDKPVFIPGATTFDGQINAMSISAVADGWLIENWTPQEDDCGFCVTGPEEISQLILPDLFISGTGNAYYISFEIRDRTQGTVGVSGFDASISSDDTLFATNNGFYGFYFTVENGNTRIQFNTVDDFDGCIYAIKVYTQCRNHRVLLTDGAQQTLLADLSSTLRYDFNWITLPALHLFGAYAMVVGECYKIVITTECYSQDQSLIDMTLENWAMGTNSEYDPDSDRIQMDGTSDPADISYSYSGDDIDCTRCFILEIIVTQHDGAPGFMTIVIGGKTIVTDLPVNQTGVIKIHLDTEETSIPCPIQAGGKIEIAYRDSLIRISEINLYYDDACSNGEEITGEFVSNCIQYLGLETANPCMSLMLAGMDNQPTDFVITEAYVTPREAYGFLFGVGFRPSFREHFVFHNSHHVGGSNTYKYNNGTNKRTSGETEKRWDVSVSHVDENLHDTIALFLKLDWILFTLNYQFTPYQQKLYIGTENDYQPNWSQDAKTVTADGKFEVSRKRYSGRFSNNII